MRAHSPALALAAALLAAPAARADEPPTIELAVGEESPDLGVMPNCDDLGVAEPKANGRGVRARRAGTTLCSFDPSGGGGIRRLYRIVVTAPPPKAAGAREAGAPPSPPSRER